MPIDKLLGIMGETPAMTSEALNGQFNDLANGLDMTLDPLLSVNQSQLNVLSELKEDINVQMLAMRDLMSDMVNYQSRTANEAKQQADATKMLVAANRQAMNKPAIKPALR